MYQEQKFLFYQKRWLFGTVILALLLLPACRIIPVYQQFAPPQGGELQEAALQEKLATIKILPPESHFEQVLHKELAFLLYNGHENNLINYHLKLNTHYRIEHRGDIDIGDITFHEGLPTITRIVAYGQYQLTSHSSDSAMSPKLARYESPKLYSEVSFYRAFSAYAHKVEIEEACRKLAQNLAQMLYLDLIYHLKIGEK